MTLNRHNNLQDFRNERDVLISDVEFGDFMQGLLLKLRRNWQIPVLLVSASAVLSVLYVLAATPVFTASGSLLIDPRTGVPLTGGGGQGPQLLNLDELLVDSELLVLTSREVTTEAMRAADFTTHMATSERGGAPQAPGLRSRLTDLLNYFLPASQTAAGTASATDDGGSDDLPFNLGLARKTEAERRDFMRDFKVERVGDSYVINVNYTSSDVVFAAEAVNALMRTYLQVSSRQQTSSLERTRDWLSDRILEMEVDLRAAENAVEAFRSSNDLVALRGELLPSEVALNSATETLIGLRQEAVLLDVQAAQLAAQLETGNIDTIVLSETQGSDVLDELLERNTALRIEERELLVELFETAPAVVNNRQQQERLRGLIFAELQSILERIEIRSAFLNDQMAAVQTVIMDLRSDYNENTRKSVELRNLEREVSAQRSLYEQLLTEYNSSSQLLTFDTTSARVIAWAVPPDRKSAPLSRQIVVLAVFAACVLSFALILIRELWDGKCRTITLVTEDLNLNMLGVMPTFGTETWVGTLIHRLFGAAPNKSAFQSPEWRALGRKGGLLRYADNNPDTVSAEAMRSLQVQLLLEKKARGQSGKGQVVGFTSTTKYEGKTTTTFNFACVAARQGARVVVLDGDLLTRELSKLVLPLLKEETSFPQLLEDSQQVIGALRPLPEFENLFVIGNPPRSEDRIATAAGDHARIEAALEALRLEFDFVVVDLPPVQGWAGTLLWAVLCDHLVYNIRWGKTLRSSVKGVFDQRLLPRDRLLGVLYTRANVRKFGLYNENRPLRYHYYGSD